MPGASVETVSRSLNWHQSGLALIQDCARAWYLEYGLGVPVPPRATAVSGTAYHKALEKDEIRRMRGEALHTFEELVAVGERELDRLTKRMPQEVVDAYVFKTKTKTLTRDAETLSGRAALSYELRTALHHYWNTPDKETGETIRQWLHRHTPIETEKYLKVNAVRGARTLAGTLDGVYQDEDGEYVLIDHKTASAFIGWERENCAEHRPQAAMYGLLAVLSPSIPVEALPKMTFLIARKREGTTKAFEGARIITLKVTKTDILELGKTVRKAESIIEAGTFPRNPLYQWCSRCPFNEKCVQTGEYAVAASRLTKENTT